MRTRVKVQTAALLEAVKAKRSEVVKAHDRQAKAYAKRESDYRAAVVKALRERADKVEAGGPLPENGYSRTVRIGVPVEQPCKPTLATTKIDRVIRTLEMAAEDSITISGDDYAEYIG